MRQPLIRCRRFVIVAVMVLAMLKAESSLIERLSAVQQGGVSDDYCPSPRLQDCWHISRAAMTTRRTAFPGRRGTR